MPSKLSAKLILVGSSGVGKTSLVSCFFKQQFDSRALPTVAPAFCTAQVDTPRGESVDLQIWDTAGQEQYQAISQMFYRDSAIALVCFNVAEFDSIPRWIERVKEHAADCLIYLVATQSDLLDETQFSALTGKTQKASEEFKAKVFITSAKTGQGVADLFQYAAGHVVGSQAPVTPVIDLIDPSGAKKGGGKSCC